MGQLQITDPKWLPSESGPSFDPMTPFGVPLSQDPLTAGGISAGTPASMLMAKRLTPPGNQPPASWSDRLQQLASWMTGGNQAHLYPYGGVYYKVPLPEEVFMGDKDWIREFRNTLRAPGVEKQVFDVKKSRPVITEHDPYTSGMPGDQTSHRIEFGVIPEGSQETIPVGKTILWTGPEPHPLGTWASPNRPPRPNEAYVGWAERDPRVNMSMGEFQFLRDKFAAMVEALTGLKPHSHPSSSSRNRLYGEYGWRRENNQLPAPPVDDDLAAISRILSGEQAPPPVSPALQQRLENLFRVNQNLRPPE